MRGKHRHRSLLGEGGWPHRHACTCAHARGNTQTHRHTASLKAALFLPAHYWPPNSPAHSPGSECQQLRFWNYLCVLLLLRHRLAALDTSVGLWDHGEQPVNHSKSSGARCSSSAGGMAGGRPLCTTVVCGKGWDTREARVAKV